MEEVVAQGRSCRVLRRAGGEKEKEIEIGGE